MKPDEQTHDLGVPEKIHQGTAKKGGYPDRFGLRKPRRPENYVCRKVQPLYRSTRRLRFHKIKNVFSGGA